MSLAPNASSTTRTEIVFGRAKAPLTLISLALMRRKFRRASSPADPHPSDFVFTSSTGSSNHTRLSAAQMSCRQRRLPVGPFVGRKCKENGKALLLIPGRYPWRSSGMTEFENGMRPTVSIRFCFSHDRQTASVCEQLLNQRFLSD